MRTLEEIPRRTPGRSLSAEEINHLILTVNRRPSVSERKAREGGLPWTRAHRNSHPRGSPIEGTTAASADTAVKT